jgi:hypothetical protein
VQINPHVGVTNAVPSNVIRARVPPNPELLAF